MSLSTKKEDPIEMEKQALRKKLAAITAAIELYLHDEINAPPFIILPQELQTLPSPWRFVGRRELMDGRSRTQMRLFKR